MTERVRTVVVGGGYAGLACSVALAERDVEHVVLERGRVGESWRSQRWDSFRLNSLACYSGMNGEHFPTGAEFVASLEERAAALPVRTGTEVARVWRQRGGRYPAATSDGVNEADHVVAASGAPRVPRIPMGPNDVSARGI